MGRKTRRKFSSEEKIRIVLDGLRGESSIAELCRREGTTATCITAGAKTSLGLARNVFQVILSVKPIVIPAKRGRGKKAKVPNDKQDQTQAERRVAMTWAQRLKRVFNIDIA